MAMLQDTATLRQPTGPNCGMVTVSASQAVLSGQVRRIAKLYEKQGQPQRIATVDQDATIIESHKQAAYSHYEEGRGYQPMVAVWAEADLVLAAAYRAGVPCYTSSPGDSTIGMNVAGVELRGNKLRMNPSIDVNETTAYVLAAKRSGGKSAVVLWGGGSPKNFMLQTEPQIQEVLRIKEYGQDYFLQVTDARPDTGGLSGATPSEAVSWGKVDPERLPDAVVCYTDTTIAMPILTHYALSKHAPRPSRRLYDQRGEMMKALTREYLLHNPVKMADGSEPLK